MTRAKRTNPPEKIDEDPTVICRPDYVRVIVMNRVVDVSRKDGSVRQYGPAPLPR